ncbi:hypothetical protein J2W35_006451 [Variovorax boronicumulans]|uniref:Ig-like domain-containing protein n=1 Tax=Variovorax boronicumulans TaxID=436515 RepID=UPI002789DA3C|nr:Ig-like domain-containing protein [Variovorax boronicumulans]MDQ0086070.1 hypothetical protein [Variovorax boronicumulans]
MSTQKQPSSSEKSLGKNARGPLQATLDGQSDSATAVPARNARAPRGQFREEDEKERDDSAVVQIASDTTSPTPATPMATPAEPASPALAGEADNAVISALPDDAPVSAIVEHPAQPLAAASGSDWDAGLIGLGALLLGGAALGGGGSGGGSAGMPLPVLPPSLPVDKTAPTVSVSTDHATLKAGQAATITFTFSEDPGSSFTADAITVKGGTLGAISGTGLTRTVTFTPASDSTEPASISVASGKFTDAAGNANTDGADADNVVTMTVDTLHPSIAITSSQPSLKAGETSIITFTFSEDPGTSFDASDIVVAGGTLSEITGTGLTRTATFTPTPGAATTASISVADGKFMDAAGNLNTDGADVDNHLSIAVDTVPPTVAVTSSTHGLKSGETATITFTFSEDPGASFDANDVAITGGTLGEITGTGLTRTATFTPTPGSTTPASVSVASGTFTDAAGNANADGSDADNTVSISVDTALPTVAITSDHASLKAGETATITFTFSEDPGTSFDASDITVAGGTLSAISGTGLTRTATFTPTPGSTTPASVSVASGTFTDAAGNANADGADADNTVSISVDTALPTVAITSDHTALKAGETATITFTFSEDPGTSFDASDITVAGGTLSAISGTGLTRTATFTPTAGASSASVSVASGTFTDAAGNANADGADANNTVTLALDTVLPTVAITSDHTALKAGETATITFTFSDDPGTSFGASDITVAGGTLSAISGTGLTRTATFTPTPGSTTPASVSVGSGKFTDAAGNANADGSDADNTVSMSVDTALPTVAVTSDHASLKAGETATITFTFSEDPGTSFDASDITVAGGTLSAISGTGLTRTATFTPTPGSTTPASVSVGSGKFTDAAGNANADGADADNTVNMTVDTALPTVAITSDHASLKAGETATFTFTFSEDPGTSFDASDITVAGGTLSAISGTGLTRTATFTPTAGASSASVSVASGTFTDAAGNANADGADANNTVTLALDTVLPTVAITSDHTALKAGETATITFTFSDDPGTSFGASDITVAGGTLGAISGTGLTRTVTFTPTPGSTTPASVSVGSGKFTDAAGNANADGADADNTVSMSVDTALPTVAVTSDHTALKAGETATITFTFSEDPGTSFDASDITVAGGTLSAISGTGLTRTATFTPAAGASSASVSVASGKFTDAAGNANADGADADNTVSMSMDTVPPTVAITSDHAALIAGETATITFTFSEDPGASFTGSDIAVTGGTLSAISGTGLTRTAVFTPAAGATSADISVASGTFTDAAGNANADGADANNKVTLAMDTTLPTVALTTSDAALVMGETATITFTFSEDPGTSFTASDITVTGGTLGALSGTGLTRTATFTPTPDSTTPASVSVASGKFTDAAGNANADGAEANNTVNMTVDTVPPTVQITSAADDAGTVTGNVASGGQTDDTTLVLRGTISEALPPNGVVAIYDGATKIGNAVVTGTTWSFDTASLAQGHHPLTARVETGALSGPSSAVYDVKEQSLSEVTPLNSSTGTAAPTMHSVRYIALLFNSDNNGTLDLSEIQIMSGGQNVARNASVSWFPAENFINGDLTDSITTDTQKGIVILDLGALYDVDSVTLTNPQANLQVYASPVAFPGLAADAASMRTLTSGNYVWVGTANPSGDDVTFTTPADSPTDPRPKLSGTLGTTLGSGEQVGVYDGSTRIGTAVVGANGTSWTFTPTTNFTDGTHVLHAEVENASGVPVGVQSTTTTIFVSTTPPSETVRITGMADNRGGTQGGLALSGNETDDPQPQLSGTISATLGVGEHLVVYDGTTRLGFATVNGTSWNFTPPDLAAGQHNFTARVENAAGNGASSNTASTYIQSSTIHVVDDFGTYKGTDSFGPWANTTTNDRYTDDATPTITGRLGATLVAGDKVSIYDNGVKIGEATVSGLNWSFTPTVPMAAGEHVLMAQIQNASGAMVGIDPMSHTIEIVPAVAPTNTALITAFNDDSNPVIGVVPNGGVTNDIIPLISGTIAAPLGAGESVALYDGATRIGFATVNGTSWTFNNWPYDGNWGFSHTDAGTHNYTARVESPAGNGASSPNYQVTIVYADTSGYVDNVGSTQGTFGDGSVTDDTTPEFIAGVPAAVTLPAGYVVAFYDGNTRLGTATQTTATAWRFTPSTPMTPGAHTIRARIEDPNGNIIAEENNAPFLINITSATGAPTQTAQIVSATDNVGPTTGNVSAGGQTDDTTLALAGTLSAALTPATGSTLRVFDNGVLLGTATVSGTSWTYNATLNPGQHNLTVQVVSASGSGTASSGYALKVQNMSALTLTDDVGSITGTVSINGTTDDSRPHYSGTLGTTLGGGEKVSIYEGSTKLGEATVSGTSWAFDLPTGSELAIGSHSAFARLEDSSGSALSIGPTATQNFVVQKAATINADTITLTQADLSGLQAFAGTQTLVDGLAGSDVLRLDTTGNLDLTTKPATLLKGLEAIDLMAGNGKSMTLTLAAQDVLDMTQGTDQWSSLGGLASGTGRSQLKLDGGSGDQLDLDIANWTDKGTLVSGGVTYHVYDSNVLNAELLVASTIAVI